MTVRVFAFSWSINTVNSGNADGCMTIFLEKLFQINMLTLGELNIL